MDLTSTMFAPIGAYITHNLPIAFSAIAVLVLTFVFIGFVIRQIKSAIMGHSGSGNYRDGDYCDISEGSTDRWTGDFNHEI